MKIPFTLKQLILLGAAIIIAAFLISGFTYSLIEYSKTAKDWASATIQSLGNIIGGVLGGIVAIIVAAYQINRTLQIENRKQFNTSVAMLKLIREELRDNITTLESLLPYNPESFETLKPHISDEIWKSTVINLVVSDQLLVKLNIAYKKTIILKNLNPQIISDQIIKDSKDQINITLENLKTEIKTVEKKLGIKENEEQEG